MRDSHPDVVVVGAGIEGASIAQSAIEALLGRQHDYPHRMRS